MSNARSQKEKKTGDGTDVTVHWSPVSGEAEWSSRKVASTGESPPHLPELAWRGRRVQSSASQVTPEDAVPGIEGAAVETSPEPVPLDPLC